MKNKLRKITIDTLEYLYTVTGRYHTGTKTNTLTVKVFLKGHKQTPLVVEFLTLDDYYMGQVLKSGIRLRNLMADSWDMINMNEPRYIRMLILQGRKNGWMGSNKVGTQDGLRYLNELGYDTDVLKPVHSNDRSG